MDVRALSTARRIRAAFGTVPSPLAGERTPPAGSHDKRKPEQRSQLGNASLQRRDLLPKRRLGPFRSIETDDAAR
jgi:hypothetical protein